MTPENEWKIMWAWMKKSLQSTPILRHPAETFTDLNHVRQYFLMKRSKDFANVYVEMYCTLIPIGLFL